MNKIQFFFFCTNDNNLFIVSNIAKIYISPEPKIYKIIVSFFSFFFFIWCNKFQSNGSEYAYWNI